MKNVILLTVDCLRSDYFKKENLPHLWELVEGGAYFKKAYALGPWSPPAVNGLFTSTYPLMYDEQIAISQSVPTLAEVMKNNGYKTAGFTLGGWLSPFFNFDRGFDHFVWEHGKEREISSKSLIKLKDISAKIKSKMNQMIPALKKVHRLVFLIRNMNKKESNDEIQLRNALEWIKENKEDKFFVYMHLEDTHEPYFKGASPFELIKANYNLLKREEKLKRSDIELIRKLYEIGIRRTDENISRFIEEIKKLGIFDESYIILFGDHGQQLYERGSFGHGSDFYEENICTPLVILGPGIKAKKIDEPISFLDLSPTILDILKIKKPEIWLGESLIRKKREDIFSEDGRGEELIFPNIENLKYNLNKQKIAVINKNYKYIYQVNGKAELYNLEKDPGERENIVEKEKETAERLKEKIIKQLEFEKKTRRMQEEVERIRGSLG